MEVYTQLIINGILVGGIYALIAVGLNMIFGVMDVINFAHGEYLMLGMYGAFWLFSKVAFDPYLSVVVILPTFFILGVVTQRLLIKPILNAPMFAQLFATFGLSIALQNFALFLWKADYRITNPAYASKVLRVSGLLFNVPLVVAFLACVVTVILLMLFLKKTFLGKAIRAVSQNRQGAAIVGINIQRIYYITFGISLACVGVAACVMSPLYYVAPTVGLPYAITAFVICVMGGLGNVPGAFFGGLIIGIVESLSGYFLSTHLKEAVYFVIFLFVLFLRPSGLFSKS